MIAEYSPRIGRRIASVLFVTQSLASAGLIAAFTVNAIVGAQLSGNEALAGLPGMWLQIGGAMMAYPAGRFMQRFGRRPGLSLGFLLGALGMLTSGSAVVMQSFALFLLGLTFLGASRGVIDQSRYAAADAQPPANRARAISTVVFASTVGAIGGPALVAPLGNFVAQFGFDRLAGPMLGGSALMAVGAVVMFVMLRPDPRDIARAIAAANPEQELHHTYGRVRRLAEIVRLPAAQLAVTAMIFGQGVMTMVMGVTSLHMSHHNHGLGDISLVFGAHTLGMFGMSFVTGFVTDRFGRQVTIMAGALMLVAGALLAPFSLMTPWIALALFIVGLGWNLCYISGSSLLSDTLAPAERGQYQGMSDLSVNASAALSSISSGFIMAAFGYGLLCAFGAVLALTPLAVLVLHSVRGRLLAPRSA
ncbi:MAG TPA: MFS transporter [Roseiflexaceae bacterium]|nr:MFS transporter [Roseiflexaceae bacterium]